MKNKLLISTAIVAIAFCSNAWAEDRIIVDTNSNVEQIEGLFENLSTQSQGTAIYNQGSIGSINGEFIKNVATYGGAISNRENAIIDSIAGSFTSNSSEQGGAILNGNSANDFGKITSIDACFYNNSATVRGGAIANYGEIESIGGSFQLNTVDSSSGEGGGAISNYYTVEGSGYIGTINAEFIENSGVLGGAIFNRAGIIDNIYGSFTNNIMVLDRGKFYKTKKL